MTSTIDGPSAPARLGAQGRVVLPAAVRHAAVLEEGVILKGPLRRARVAG